MEDRKRRSSPLGDGSDGHAAQKRKLSSLDAAQSDAAAVVEEKAKSLLDSALGLEDGFLEVSPQLSNNDSRSTSVLPTVILHACYTLCCP